MLKLNDYEVFYGLIVSSCSGTCSYFSLDLIQKFELRFKIRGRYAADTQGGLRCLWRHKSQAWGRDSDPILQFWLPKGRPGLNHQTGKGYNPVVL